MKTHKILIVKNKLGLHARPAALFVKLANKFESEIMVSKGRIKVDGKSILGMMMLAAGKDSKVLVEVEGLDAKEAIKEIEDFLENKAL